MCYQEVEQEASFGRVVRGELIESRMSSRKQKYEGRERTFQAEETINPEAEVRQKVWNLEHSFYFIISQDIKKLLFIKGQIQYIAMTFKRWLWQTTLSEMGCRGPM